MGRRNITNNLIYFRTSNWAIDDVAAVSFDTWIFLLFPGYVIEIFHDGEVRVGLKQN
ncbi:hypothetical protein ACE38V_19945 [Cytobacillus sp. Hz8]|uniref:CDI toxin immunity protein n=1 Tax=Cytobacillus sp. Hz8 TaxID=3347168 RepID=UPI0035D722F9